MHERFQTDNWQTRCGSVGCKTHSLLLLVTCVEARLLIRARTYEHGRCFAETTHSCCTDEISRCYFQYYPHNLIPLFKRVCVCVCVPPPEELRWEPKERVMTPLLGIFCSVEKIVTNRWMKPGVSAAVGGASPTGGREQIRWLTGPQNATRYEKESVGAVINHCWEGEIR